MTSTDRITPAEPSACTCTSGGECNCGSSTCAAGSCNCSSGSCNCVAAQNHCTC